MADLYRDYFVHGLTWRPTDSDLSNRKRKRTRPNAISDAPSWSWVSYDGEIMIHNARGTLEHYAELVGEGCTLILDHNPFGAVRAESYYRLKGWVIMFTVAPAPARFRDDYQVNDLLLNDCVGTKFLFRPDARVEVRATAKRPGIENP
jgi:hypothetical protein